MYGWVPYVKLLFPAIAVIGMIVVAVGAWLTASTMTGQEAIRVAGRSAMPTGYGTPRPATAEEQMQQSGVQYLVHQSRRARRGLRLVAVGTVLANLRSGPFLFRPLSMKRTAGELRGQVQR